MSWLFQMNLMPLQIRPIICQSYLSDNVGVKNMSDKSKGPGAKPEQVKAVQFTQDQVHQVQEAIRRSERDMNEWREKSRVDPQKLKEPLTR